MANIQKGTISSILGASARVIPSTGDGAPTAQLVVPRHLRSAGNLASGIQVVYVVFEDETGYIIDRADGEWNGVFPGTITASDFITQSVASYNGHTHTGVQTGGSLTGAPQ